MSARLVALSIFMIIEIAIIGTIKGSNRLHPSITYESNIRLPYKKFREIYPDRAIQYRDYKEMQTRQAFKNSIPSKQIKRMVR